MKKIVFTMMAAVGLMLTAEAQALKVASNGNVGVNKATPTQRLDVGGNVIVGNGQFYMSFRNNGTTPHQAFGMDANNDITFNRNAIVSPQVSGLILGATNGRFIDFRNQDNTVLMRVQPGTGRVGIGTTSPGYLLEVAGTAGKPGGGMWENPSDSRAKRSVRAYTDGLEEVLKINPVVYQYNGKFGTPDNEKEYVGIIAQEMQDVAPYMVAMKEYQEVKVSYSNARGTEETKGQVESFLSYDGSALPYMLVNAIKAQQERIEEQESQIEDLISQVQGLSGAVDELLGAIRDLDLGSSDRVVREIEWRGTDFAALEQNRPNPFNGETIIDYEIPSRANSGQIIFYNMSGQVVKSVDIKHTGSGQILLRASDVPSGVYNYHLIVDGVQVGAKQMILQN